MYNQVKYLFFWTEQKSIYIYIQFVFLKESIYSNTYFNYKWQCDSKHLNTYSEYIWKLFLTNKTAYSNIIFIWTDSHNKIYFYFLIEFLLIIYQYLSIYIQYRMKSTNLLLIVIETCWSKVFLTIRPRCLA